MFDKIKFNMGAYNSFTSSTFAITSSFALLKVEPNLAASSGGCTPHDRFVGIRGSFYVAVSEQFAKSPVSPYGFTQDLDLRFAGRSLR